jgi:hypothetical protein
VFAHDIKVMLKIVISIKMIIIICSPIFFIP